MTIHEALENDLKAYPQSLRDSALAAMALALAEAMDTKGSLTGKANGSRALLDVLGELKALAPVQETHDAVDDITAARARRRAATAH